MTGQPRYKKILLKMSGEVLMGDAMFGIDTKTIEAVAEDIKEVVDAGVELCLVVGGGNIFRGVSLAGKGMDRASADYMGMLATVMNALALQGALEKAGVHTRVQSAIPMDAVCEPYIRRRAMRHLEKGRVVIFAAGLGRPSSRQTRRPPCGLPKWAVRPCSRGPPSTGSIRQTPRRIRPPSGMRPSAITMSWRRTSG